VNASLQTVSSDDTAALRARVEDLYARLAPRLMNFLIANGSAPALAADIVQEAFLRLWKMRDRLVDDDAQISGLLYTIARNLRADHARLQRREVLEGDIRDASAAPGESAVPVRAVTPVPGHAADRAYLRSRLAAALEKVPPLLREAYLLFQVQELPIREIARRLEISESLVKVRIFRAKEKLRPLLADLL